MSKKLDKFISDYIELIDANKFELLFDEARSLLYDEDRRELVKILDEAQIPYLEYMNEINVPIYARSNYKSLKIPGNIKKITSYTFANSSLENIEIEEGCEVIGAYAFTQCYSLDQVILPKSLKLIEGNVFGELLYPPNITYNGTADEWCAIEKRRNWWWLDPPDNVTKLIIKCRNGIYTEKPCK